MQMVQLCSDVEQGGADASAGFGDLASALLFGFLRRCMLLNLQSAKILQVLAPHAPPHRLSCASACPPLQFIVALCARVTYGARTERPTHPPPCFCAQRCSLPRSQALHKILTLGHSAVSTPRALAVLHMLQHLLICFPRLTPEELDAMRIDVQKLRMWTQPIGGRAVSCLTAIDAETRLHASSIWLMLHADAAWMTLADGAPTHRRAPRRATRATRRNHRVRPRPFAPSSHIVPPPSSRRLRPFPCPPMCGR